MRKLRRSLLVFGLLLGSAATGCQTQMTEIAAEPPVRKADSGGLLLNNGGIQLGPGAGSPSGYRWMGDSEWGF